MPDRHPANLGPAGKALWNDVREGLDLRPDELAILATAARTADQIADLEETLAAAEPVIPGSRGQQILHPVIGELRQQRHLLASLLGRLDIPEDRDAIGTEWDGISASSRARKAARARWGRAA